MRFLIFSDLRLDDGGTGHASRRRADLWACLDRILALAEAHEVDAILSAGDLYEHRHVHPGTASLLVDRFGQAGRPVFLAPGDADPHTPDSLYATTTWPANVHVFDHDLLVPVELADGFRLWGAAHLGHDGTPGFLDGFRISDDGVDLALFHDTAPVTPLRAEQVEQAGLTHAFVGHGSVAVDARRHTSPGTPAPTGVGAPNPRGVVIVDVAPDGSLRRQRFGVAAPPVHEVVREATAAHDAWQQALASLRHHARQEPAPVERPALGGMALGALEAHLQTLRADTASAPDTSSEASGPDDPPTRPAPRWRGIARVIAYLVAVSSAVGLFVLADTTLERAVPVAGLVIVVVLALVSRRAVGEDPEVAATRARVQATLQLSTEFGHARHAAATALRQAGLPTDPAELEALVEAGRVAEARDGARTAWEQRRAGRAADLAEATWHLRAVLRRAGIADTMDVEAAWARFQAGVRPGRSMLQPSPQASPPGVRAAG